MYSNEASNLILFESQFATFIRLPHEELDEINNSRAAEYTKLLCFSLSFEESKNYFKHKTTNSIRKLGYCCFVKGISGSLFVIHARSHDEYWKRTVLIGEVSVKIYAD